MIGELNRGTRVVLLIVARLLGLLALVIVVAASPLLRGWITVSMVAAKRGLYALAAWVDHRPTPAPPTTLHPVGRGWIVHDHAGLTLAIICATYLAVAVAMWVQRKRKADGSTAGRTVLFLAVLVVGAALVLAAVSSIGTVSPVQHPIAIALRDVGDGFGHAARWLSARTLDT